MINIETPLCQLLYDYGSDKCPQVRHTYSPEYYKLLKPRIDSCKMLLEIGIGTQALMHDSLKSLGRTYEVGASLKAWRDFFPNAIVFGVDIDSNVLFQEERIKCFFADQSNTASLTKCMEEIKAYSGDNRFDVVVDDGSHVLAHQVLSANFFCNGFLKEDGLYIVEDIFEHKFNAFPREINGFKVTMEYVGVDGWDSFLVYSK